MRHMTFLEMKDNALVQVESLKKSFHRGRISQKQHLELTIMVQMV